VKLSAETTVSSIPRVNEPPDLFTVRLLKVVVADPPMSARRAVEDYGGRLTGQSRCRVCCPAPATLIVRPALPSNIGSTSKQHIEELK
jgi:hypothetical protein